MIRRLVLLTSLFLAFSCSKAPETKPSEAIKPSDEPAAKTPAVSPTSNARLVRNEEAKRWPHLQRHIGQLLLMNKNLQVLIPPAPPLANEQIHFPLISKVYRLQGKDWIALPYFPSLDISLQNKNGEALQLIGQDIIQDNGTDAVVAFFRRGKSGAEDARLIFKLLIDQGRIDVKVSSSDPGLHYTLRLNKGLSEDHPIPLTAKTIAGLTTALLPEAFSVIGYKPFYYSPTDTAHLLIAEPKNPGFSILLSRDALLFQPDLIHSLTACYATADVPPACQNIPNPKSGKVKTSWKLEAPKLKKGEQAIWQSAMIYNKQGSFRALIPIREGESLEVPLSFNANTKWELLASDGQDILQKNELPQKQLPVLRLPKINKGTLVIKSDREAARYIQVKNATQKNGKSLLAWVNEEKNFLLSPNIILQSQWPFSLPLPTGDYSVKIYDGFRILCEQRITVLRNRRNTIECNEPPMVPAYSVRAAISVDSAAIPEDLLKASGITVITSSERSKSKTLTEIPVLAAYDSQLGLSIRAFPSTPELENGWNGLIKNNPERSTLSFFTDYIRSHQKDSSLVLDCPPPGFQLSEYQWISLNIKPDVLEVFGCQDPSSARALLDIAGKLQQQKETPVRLAAASFGDSFYGTRVPAIYLPRYKHFNIVHKTDAINPRLALSDLQNGEYTLGFRTELAVPKASVNDKKLKLQLKTSDPVPRKIIVRVHDQDDRLSEIEMRQDTRLQTLDVPLSLRPTSKFLRVEVLGRDNPDDALFTLATSNYFRLDGASTPSDKDTSPPR